MVALPDFLSRISLADVLSFIINKSFSFLFVVAFSLFIAHVWTEYQTYQYYKLYSYDLPFSRRLVLTILILETFTTAVCVLAERHHEAHNYPRIVSIDQWSVNLFTPIAFVVLLVFQRIYTRCVHLISLRLRIFVAVTLLLTLTGLGLAIVAILQGELSRMGAHDIDWFLFSSFGSTLVGGLAMTGILVGTLLFTRLSLQCHSLVEILIVYALNAGLFASMFSLAALLFAVVRPEHLPMLGIVMIGVKLFTTGRLAVKIHLYHLMVHPPRRSSPSQAVPDQEKKVCATRCSTSTNISQASPRNPTRAESTPPLPASTFPEEERTTAPLIVV